MEESLTDSTYLFLLALLESKHGYAIMKEISEITNEKLTIGPASMYTIKKTIKKLINHTRAGGSPKKDRFNL